MDPAPAAASFDKLVYSSSPTASGSALPSPPHSPPSALAVPPTSAEKLALAAPSAAPLASSSSSAQIIPASASASTTGQKRKRDAPACAAPAEADRAARRKEQNRRAQQAFRARKEGEVAGLRSIVLACAPVIDSHLATEPARFSRERAFLREWRAANAGGGLCQGVTAPMHYAASASPLPSTGLLKLEDPAEETPSYSASGTSPSRSTSTPEPDPDEALAHARAALAARTDELGEALALAARAAAARDAEAHENSELRRVLVELARGLRTAESERDIANGRCAAARARAEDAERVADRLGRCPRMTPAALDAIRVLGQCAGDDGPEPAS